MMGYDSRTMDPQEPRASARTAADRVYDRIVRDLFGRVVPGLLLLFALAVTLTSFLDVTAALERATWWMWPLAYGAGWLTTLALLELGRRCSLVVLAPDPVTDAQYWAAEERFRGGASRRQRAEYERLVTMREAAAAISVSLFMSLLILGADFVIDVHLHDRPWDEVRNAATAVATFVILGFALQLAHHFFVRRAWACLSNVPNSQKV
jgi:hypothetical protein